MNNANDNQNTQAECLSQLVVAVHKLTDTIDQRLRNLEAEIRRTPGERQCRRGRGITHG